MAHAQSLARAFQDVKSGKDFHYTLMDFLDRFRHAPDRSLLAEEPQMLVATLNDEGVADAFLASVAATLAHEQGWREPEWAEGTKRAVAKPYFAAKSAKLKAVFLQESPTEFRLRHLFVSANALSRA